MCTVATYRAAAKSTTRRRISKLISDGTQVNRILFFFYSFTSGVFVLFCFEKKRLYKPTNEKKKELNKKKKNNVMFAFHTFFFSNLINNKYLQIVVVIPFLFIFFFVLFKWNFIFSFFKII